MPRFVASVSRLPRRFGALDLSWAGVQRELGARVDLRRTTVVMVEQVLKAEGIEFEELPGGGFKVVVPEGILSKLERAAGDN